MSRLATSAMRTALNTAAKVGATLPKGFVDRQKTLDKLTGKVRQYQLEPHPTLADAFLDALAHNRDPATDPAVQAAATAYTLDGFQGGIEQGLDRRAQEFVDANAPAILTAFAKPFDNAADTITTALEKLGDVDLSDTAAILSRGGDAARVWTDAREADETIRQIHQAWGLLGGAASSVPYNSRYRLLVIAHMPAETFIADQLANSSMTAWEAARKGYTLSLATPEIYRERMAAIPAAQAVRQAVAESAFTEGYRRTHGTGQVAAS